MTRELVALALQKIVHKVNQRILGAGRGREIRSGRQLKYTCSVIGKKPGIDMKNHPELGRRSVMHIASSPSTMES